MKKLLLFIALVLCCAMTTFAQNNKISYQAVVRDAQNRLVANKTVTVTVNIYNGTETTAAYIETQTATTNLNGLVSLQIGPDGDNAAWSNIQWKNASIKTTVTLDGTSLGTLGMPLTAVPYAKYADYAESVNSAAIAKQIHDTAAAIRTSFPPFPTNVSDLDNDAHYLTCDSSCIQTLYNLVGQLQQQVNTLQQQIVALTPQPTVTTTAATNVTGTSATSGGNVTAEVSSAVTARGVRWGTDRNNLSYEVAADQAGAGEFTVNITGLEASTTYYVCAYATTSKGTAYGDTVSFTTANAPVTVTWNKSDIVNQGSSNSFTKDGVTITAGNIDWNSTNFMSGGTFTTTLGNFTKIEITGESLIEFSGTGWSGSNGKRTWEGTASNSVPFSGYIISMGGDYNFVFTIEANN